MSNTTYVVEGMTCGSWAGKVTDRVEQIPGVTDVDVDIATGGVTLTTDAPVSDETVKQAIEEIGYKVAAA